VAEVITKRTGITEKDTELLTFFSSVPLASLRLKSIAQNTNAPLYSSLV